MFKRKRSGRESKKEKKHFKEKVLPYCEKNFKNKINKEK